jgi:hypothetical protein
VAGQVRHVLEASRRTQSEGEQRHVG